MENNYDIDDFYRDRFQNFETQPGLNSFDKVLSKLDAAKRKKRRRFFFYLFSGVSIISLLTYLNSLLPITHSKNSSAVLPNTKNINIRSVAATNVDALPLTTNKNNGQNNLTVLKKNTSGSDLSLKNETPNSPGINEKKISENSILGNVSSLKRNSFRTTQAPFNEKKDHIYSGLEKTDSSQIASDISLSVLNDKQQSEQEIVLKPVSGSDQFPDILALKIMNGLPATSTTLTIIPNSGNSDLSDKLHLSLKAKDFKTNFFVAANYLLLFYESKYKKNPNTTHKTAYGDDFSDFYVTNRNNQKEFDFVGVPALKIGLVNQNKWEIGIGFGYYKLKISETILYPETDTSKIISTVAPAPFNITYTNTKKLNTLTYENEYRYFYYSADISRIIKLNRYNLKPGVGINFCHALKSSYIMVDTSGYVYTEKKQDHLNRNIVNLSFKLGLSKKLTKNIDYQVTPTYVLGLNSIFNSNYFLSQKLRGIGLEAALIYTIRSK